MTEAHAHGRIGRAIAAIVRVGILRPWLTLALVFALAAASLYYAAGNLGINTDTADMISPALKWRQDFIAYRDGFPARDSNIVAVIEGPDPEASFEYANELADRLAAESALFPTVFFAGGGDFFERNGLLYLPVDELESLADRLFDAQPLLGRLSRDVTGAGVLAVLRESIEQNDRLTSRAAADLERIFEEIALTLRAGSEDASRPIAWSRLIGAAPEPAARQLVLIKPALDFNRVRPALDAIERIREIGRTLDESHGNQVGLRLTGTLAMEHEELSSITRSASTAGLAALAMVAIVLFWALRSPVLLTIAVVVLLSGLSLTAAFAALTVGHLNLLSVAFAVLYIVLGVDFILHVCLRLEELRAEGHDLDSALIETAGGVGSSLLICAVTTAAGFFAFIPTDFDGVSELGLISGAGMLISFAVSLSLLPALIKLFWRGGGARRATRAGRRRLIPIRLRPGLVVAAAAVITLGALALLPSLEFDGNPIHLRDPESESIRALEDLAADAEAPVFDLVVLVPDSATAETTAEALASLPTVEQVQTAASLVPDHQSEKLAIIDDLELVLGSTLADFEPGSADPDRVVTELEALIAAIASRAPGPAAETFGRNGRQWLAHWRSLAPSAARLSAQTLDSDLLGNLVEQLGRLERGLDARPFGRADLPSVLLDRWVNASGQELVEIVPREDLNDNEALERFVADVRSVAPSATGLPVVYEEAAATVTRAFAIALAYAFGIVSVLLIFMLKSVRDAVLVLIPIAFAAILTAAVSVLLGLPLNFANIIALPLLVGVGVDSGIHMVHRMRTDPPSDGDLLNTSTSRAVLMSALTTIASFGNLAFSSHLGMASMGQLLTLGMVMSLIAVLGLLPALLRLWGRA
jgi:uncharacterized protein